MPLLFGLGKHWALVAGQARLRESERLFAFLGDVYIICAPDRAEDVHKIFAGGILEAREDSIPPREDEDVESERRVLDPDAVVAREPRIAHLCSRVQSFGCSHWPPGFCGGIFGQKDERTPSFFERIPVDITHQHFTHNQHAARSSQQSSARQL